MNPTTEPGGRDGLFVRLCLFILVSGGFLLLVRAIYPGPEIPLGHDQVSYIFEAQRFLSGAQPYGPLLSETNPPLIIWFSALPILLSHSLRHGDVLFYQRVLVTAMILASALWCTRILRRETATRLIAAPLGCFILSTEYFIGDIDFGQREHLLVILLLPFLLAVVTGAVSRLALVERCFLGITAGIGIWFKPQGLPILLALEFLLALRRRSLRRLATPELPSFVLTCFAILGLVRLFAPLYLSETLPLLVDTYWAFGTHTALALALDLQTYTAFVFAGLAACFLLRKYLSDVTTAVALLLCSFIASLAYDVQHTMWHYHLFPALALLQVALAYVLTDLIGSSIRRSASNRLLARRTVVVAGGIMAVSLGLFALSHRMPRIFAKHSSAASVRKQTIAIGKPDELRTYLAQCKPSTTVYVFATSVPALSIAYLDHLSWGSRFVHLWMLPAIVQNQLGRTGPAPLFKHLSPQKLASLSSLQRTEMAEDLNYWYPSVVVVEHCTVKHACQGIGNQDFDMLSWFLEQPEFAAAWSHYHRQSTQLENYDLYQRDE